MTAISKRCESADMARATPLSTTFHRGAVLISYQPFELVLTVIVSLRLPLEPGGSEVAHFLRLFRSFQLSILSVLKNTKVFQVLEKNRESNICCPVLKLQN